MITKYHQHTPTLLKTPKNHDILTIFCKKVLKSFSHWHALILYFFTKQLCSLVCIFFLQMALARLALNLGKMCSIVLLWIILLWSVKQFLPDPKRFRLTQKDEKRWKLKTGTHIYMHYLITKTKMETDHLWWRGLDEWLAEQKRRKATLAAGCTKLRSSSSSVH